jgi:predicted nucleotidyltransferase
MSSLGKWHRFKELPDDLKERLGALPELLAAEGVLLAYLFGSQAKEGAGQDVDLALLMAGERRPYELQETIERHLDTERVDIVDLQQATPVLRFEVISTGHCLYEAAERLQVEHELRWLREYKDTAWLRRHQEQLLREKLEAWSLNAKASPAG